MIHYYRPGWSDEYPRWGVVYRRANRWIRPRERLKRRRTLTDRLRGRHPEPIREALTPGAAVEDDWRVE